MKFVAVNTFLTVATLVSSYPSEDIASSLNDYAINVHRTLIAEDINIVTSPLSYCSQLSLLYLGAKNRTATELRHSLRYDLANVSEFQVHLFWKQILTRLLHLKYQAYMKMANVAVVRSDFPVSEGYRRNVKHFYNATVQVLDIYKSQEGMRSVNSFVSRTTEGKAPPVLLAPLDAYNRLALLNSAYFATKWQYKFHKIQRGSFYNRGFKIRPSHLPFMKINGSFNYAALKIYNVSIKAVELPCQDGIKILFVLPNSTMNGLIKLEQRLTGKSLKEILRRMSNSSVAVTIPKFRLQPASDLMWKIQFLGIHDAFNMAADLKNISRNSGLFVTKVLHRMNLDINDSGDRMIPALKYVDNRFVADKPFLFYVRDSVTGMILFMGRIASLASK